MSMSEGEALPGEIVEESSTLTVEDLSRMFAVDERHVVEWVEEGVLTVMEVNATAWRFSGAALRRARIAMRLERDLGVNLPGVALALDLLEELEQLRRMHGGERS